MICDHCIYNKNCCKIISENSYCSGYEYNEDKNMLSVGNTLYYADTFSKSVKEYRIYAIAKSLKKIVVLERNTTAMRVMPFDYINYKLFPTKLMAEIHLGE